GGGALALPGRIVLDVTHGFRSQPVLATAALEFVQAQRLRATPGRSDDGIAYQIVYGAWYLRDEPGIAPTLDLTHFVEVGKWNRAIDAFVRFGRADDLSHLLELLARRPDVRARKQKAPRFRKLAQALRDFADGLVTARVPELLNGLARRVEQELSNCRSGLVELVPPLTGQLDRIGSWIGPMQCDTLESRDGIL